MNCWWKKSSLQPLVNRLIHFFQRFSFFSRGAGPHVQSAALAKCDRRLAHEEAKMGAIENARIHVLELVSQDEVLEDRAVTDVRHDSNEHAIRRQPLRNCPYGLPWIHEMLEDIQRQHHVELTIAQHLVESESVERSVMHLAEDLSGALGGRRVQLDPGRRHHITGLENRRQRRARAAPQLQERIKTFRQVGQDLRSGMAEVVGAAEVFSRWRARLLAHAVAAFRSGTSSVESGGTVPSAS